MNFTASDIKSLREKTGCGMLDCKKALTETDGNLEKAVDILREKGLAAASKKSSRIAAEGLAFAKLNSDKTVGVALEVNSETDFVAGTNIFGDFVNLCADVIIEKNPASVEDLLQLTYDDSSKTVKDLLNEKIISTGENIKIRRFVRLEGVLSNYVHAGGKIGVLVKFDTSKEISNTETFGEFSKDIAMQIAAVNPLYLQKEDVPTEALEHEKKILTEQVKNEGKPDHIAEKMVVGKLGKYYKENCLLEQTYVKDNNFSVEAYTKKVAKDLDGSISVVDFVRFEKGEGLEKKQDNFADEVANLIKN